MPEVKSNLVIDIGNTTIKLGMFRNSELMDDWVFKSVHEAVKFVNSSRYQNLLICSVAKDLYEFAEEINHPSKIILSSSTPIPFENHYVTKNTLGLDRIAGLAGAQRLSRGKNNLVIDIGTCITYDFLDSDSKYHGGSISPGIELRFKSMHDYTQNLPLITNFSAAELIGQTTRNAMVSGVINGIVAELDGIIDRYKSVWTDLEVIVCGGGLKCFESKLKAHIFVAPKLVLIGLNRILEYNE